tara:strand:- start:61 stop:1998 length:1938 start_codon:yes stop_codon:yes gene_type:complete
MCGISGFTFTPSLDHCKNEAKQRILEMIEVSRHRGPDGHNFYIDEYIALGHARLSFRDLSENGSQPMCYSNNNFISFNGEIYNDADLRKATKFQDFKSSSDTESLLISLTELGIEQTLEICNGQYAFCYFDKLKGEVTLARDPFGEKPLYYHISNEGYLTFASDIFILMQNIQQKFNVCKKALNKYFNFGFTVKEETIFKEIKKVRAGKYITFTIKNGIVTDKRKVKYFQLPEKQSSSNSPLSYQQIKLQAKKYLIESVERQLIADVPIGSFLSGGIDSSLVATIAAKELNYKLKTFTIGYDDKRYDESAAAKAIAESIGSEHYEFKPQKEDLINAVTDCSNAFSEPFADSSQIPAYLISKFASKHVKAVLSGDAGDEVFGGYNRYRAGYRAWKNLVMLKKFFPKNSIKYAIKYFTEIDLIKGKGNVFGINNLDKKLSKLSDLIGTDNILDYYLIALSAGKINSNKMLLNQDFLHELDKDNFKLSSTEDIDERQLLTLLDLSIYLTDDNLVKMDRISMFHSLEVRCPFLDKHLVSFMMKQNIKERFETKESKQILRDIISEYLPKELVNQPKMGFSIPLDEFLRNDLKEWSYSLLMNTDQVYLNKHNALELWNKHQKGSDYTEEIWRAICFIQWINKESQIKNDS